MTSGEGAGLITSAHMRPSDAIARRDSGQLQPYRVTDGVGPAIRRSPNQRGLLAAMHLATKRRKSRAGTNASLPSAAEMYHLRSGAL